MIRNCSIALLSLTICLLAAFPEKPVNAAFLQGSITHTCSVRDGKASSCTIKASSLSGGPAMVAIEIGYPKDSTIEIDGALSVSEGRSNVEFIRNGKPGLTLSANGPGEAKGSGSVSASNMLQFYITAAGAKNLCLDIKLNPAGAAGQTPQPGPAVKERQGLQRTGPAVTSPGPPPTGETSSKIIIRGNISYADGTPVAGRKFYLGTVDLKNKGAVLLQINPDGTQGIASGVTDSRGLFEAIADRRSFGGSGGPYAFVAYPRNDNKETPRGLVNNKGNHMWFRITDKTDLFDFSKLGAVFNYKKDLDHTFPEPFEKYVTSVRFFESGKEAVPLKDRVFKTEFKSEETRYINWELCLKLPAPGHTITYYIEAIWFNEDNTIKAKQTKRCRIEPEWTKPCSSFGRGNKAFGSWKQGSYRVELYMEGKKIGGGQFLVR